MDDIKNTISKITKTLTKTSSGVIKSTKLNINLVNEEERLKGIYLEIGKKVHEIYMYGGTLGKFFDEKYVEIQNIEKELNRIKDEINVVKGTKECPKCGKAVSKESEFCPKCGFKMSEKSDNVNTENVKEYKKENIVNEPKIINENEKIPIKNESVNINQSKKICSVCKYENNPDDKFCMSCGRVL